jgi:pimeloyl-ACP methyl ester carboxylesterase
MKNSLFHIIYFLLISLYGISQPPVKKHPQTPLPPFIYNADSVEYDNAEKTVHFAGTFTYPKKNGPFITILMITGSGQEDRDETVFGHHPFAVISDYLTKKGYAVLRVDDRGMGKSKGEVLKATSADFAEDAITSIHYLLTRKEVNKKKIGVIGHSEGGFIAPIVYTKWPQLAFIISLAGTGVSGADILLKQQTDPVKGVVNNAAFDAYYSLTQETLKTIHDNPTKPDSVILNKVKKIYSDWKSNKPDSVLVPLRADKATPEMYANQIKQELAPWLKYFISTDPSIFWEKVKCPVLALNGEKDIQVYPEQNLTAILAALKKAGNKKMMTKILPGLNHLFQACTKCTIKEYGELEETFSPDALNIINEWLNKNIK